MSQVEVAKHFKVSSHIVRKWLRSYGTKVEELRGQSVQIPKAELIQHLKEHSKNWILNQYKISLYKLNQLIESYGVEQIPEKKTLSRAFNMHGTGEKVAEHFNVTIGTLTRWLAVYDLTVSKMSSLHPSERPDKVKAIPIDGTEPRVYKTFKDAAADLKMGAATIKKYARSRAAYQGWTFEIL
jgi:transposase